MQSPLRTPYVLLHDLLLSTTSNILREKPSFLFMNSIDFAPMMQQTETVRPLELRWCLGFPRA